MRRLKNKAMLAAKQLRFVARKSGIKPKFVHVNVPYFSQWESKKLVEQIVTRQIAAKDDPRWRESGAKDTDEYTSWSWSCCGMACLKMILAHKNQQIIPLVTLGKQCVKYGGYKLPLEEHPGLYYKPFVRFVKEKYGLSAKAVSALTLFEIKKTLSGGGYIIASVTPEIRFPDKNPSKHGGHVVLVFGYDDTRQVIYLHNSSGFEGSQEKVEIPYAQFKKFFDNKGILINPEVGRLRI